jgi:hypothetical protein
LTASRRLEVDRPPIPFRCADAARERGDPELGSAPQARRWLLIEHRGPWQVDALAGSGITTSILDLLNRTVATVGARPLLIRRPGRTDRSARRSWAVTYEEGVSDWGTWRQDDDLIAAVEALSAPGPSEDAGRAPILLVCTHGLHDACCAIRGRPVARALATQWPESTWECSHVGGDRFAANVIVLPDAVYYGNLDPVSAAETVRAHLSGELAVGHLRGMARVPPAAQVAIAAVHERLGPLAASDVDVTSLEHGSPGVWQVWLTARTAPLRSIRVTVASTWRAPAQLTCRAATATPAAGYRVVDIQLG